MALLQTSNSISEARPPIGWATSNTPVAYKDAVALMEARVRKIANGEAGELIWLLEHPPLYTAGTSANFSDLIDPDRFPVHTTGRGGQFTYNGPGQRVIYVMLDLTRHGKDIRAFITRLEQWIIKSLAVVGINGEIHPGRVGVWVNSEGGGSDQARKIAAIGVRIRKWVTFHGISINVSPDLTHFDGIVPCGISDQGVTSLSELGSDINMAAFDQILANSLQEWFGYQLVSEHAPI